MDQVSELKSLKNKNPLFNPKSYDFDFVCLILILNCMKYMYLDQVESVTNASLRTLLSLLDYEQIIIFDTIWHRSKFFWTYDMTWLEGKVLFVLSMSSILNWFILWNKLYIMIHTVGYLHKGWKFFWKCYLQQSVH